MIYTYDFGDNWEHAVVLEKQLPLLPDMSDPICIDGNLACPPDDCDGIPGFYDLLDALADPSHEQHEEMRDWVGDDFDPQAFSVDSVNRRLAPSAALHRDQESISACSYAALPKRYGRKGHQSIRLLPLSFESGPAQGTRA